MKPPLAPILIDAHNPGPLTGAGNHTYLLLDEANEGTLIDAGVGHPRHLDAIDEALNRRRARLTQVIATHGHRDHIAGAPALAQRHPDAEFFRFPGPVPHSEAGPPWRPLVGGDIVAVGRETLTVVHTPGHAPDHVTLWHAPTRAAFVGDLVIAGQSVMIDCGRGGRLVDYLASLERVLNLEPLILYPAHGAVSTAPASELTRYIRHRLERERQVVDALRAGRSAVPAIADSIYDGLEPMLMPSAIETVRAHLEKLKEEGRAVNEGDRWTLV